MSSPTGIVVGRGLDSPVPVPLVAAARALAAERDDLVVLDDPDPQLESHIYLDLTLHLGRVSELEVGLFRRTDEVSARERIVSAALHMDACVVGSDVDAELLRRGAARAVWCVPTHGLSTQEEWRSALDTVVSQLRDWASSDSLLPDYTNPRSLDIFFSGDETERLNRGGPSVRMRQTAAALEQLGHRVEFGVEPGRSTPDVVHVFNSWPPESSLERLRSARESGAAVVFSPIYMDHRESSRMQKRLKRARRRVPVSRVLTRRDWVPLRRKIERGVTRYRKLLPSMLALADHVALLSHAELLGLRALGCEPTSRSLIWNAIDTTLFRDSDPEAFRRANGLGDYVLCVGRIEFRKNQALLIEALEESGLDLVLVGGRVDKRYGALVDELATDRVMLIEHLEPGGKMLASAFSGAKVFALPSWVEGAPIAGLEAAAAGCPLVLGNRAGEREYFGSLVQYADPSSVTSIRQAIERAISSDSPQERARRRSLVVRKFDIVGAARATAAAYERVLAARASKRPR